VSDLVLVATDGGRMTAGALKLAAEYAAREHMAIEVVAVVEPFSELPMPLPHREELEQAHTRGVAERVREHLRDSVGPVAWPIHVRPGRSAPAICQAAAARRAGLVVLGLEGPKTDGNSTAMELLHLIDVPMIIAREPRLPRVAVAGIDFSPSALRAAQEAARLVGPDGVLHLVHVEPSLDFPAALVWDWSHRYGSAVSVAFDAMVDEIAVHASGEIQTHVRPGDAVTELLHMAEELGADLLAIGSDGYICNGRAVVGRVARRIVNEAPLSILAMPVRMVSEDAEAAAAAMEAGAQGVAATPVA
jgi:nucleotide-binding universal stress UspA family protein